MEKEEGRIRKEKARGKRKEKSGKKKKEGRKKKKKEEGGKTTEKRKGKNREREELPSHWGKKYITAIARYHLAGGYVGNGIGGNAGCVGM